jgi:hypothetical protein
VVRAKTSRIVHAEWTNSLSKPEKNWNMMGNTAA